MMATDERSAKLTLGVEAKGIDKSVNDLKGLDRELDKLSKDIRQNFDQSVNSVEALTDEIRGDLVSALKEADKTAEGIQIKGGAGNNGGGGAPAAAKFRGAASLVGGGEIVGLIDDLQDLGEGFSQLATQGGKLGGTLVNSLTPAMGSTAAGVAVAGAAFAAAGIAIAALGAAIKAFTDEQAKAQAVVEGIVDAQRDVDQKINQGATSQELQDELDVLIKNREDEARRVADLRSQYDQQINSQGVLTPLIKATSGAEEGLANSLSESNANVSKMDAQIKALQAGLTSGETAAADMKAAEEALEQQRNKEAQAILSQAQSAGQLVNAQRRAMDASYEQNQQRLDSIEDERAAIQAQIQVLQSSGSTAESVTSEIAKLNTQLSNLGQESEFISSTALEASRRRDAEKKAAKDAEDAARKAAQEAERNAAEQQRRVEQAAQAQQKYNDGIANANTALKQATQDINTKFSQALSDNLTGLFRDVEDIATKFRRDTFDLDIKANRAERDALTEHLREIDDIRADARKSEQEAIRDGDFKALFLAREAGAEALRNEQKQNDREGEDRRRALADERDDLLRSAQRERADRMTAYDRQNADARTAQQRELQQAQVARTRALEMNANSYRAELAQLGQFLQARNQMMDQANQQALQSVRGGGGGTSGGSAPRGIPQGTVMFALQRVVKK